MWYWKLKISKKVKIFLWSLAYRSLNIHKKLQRTFPNWSLSSICCLFLREMETIGHLFLHSEFTFRGWQILFSTFVVASCLPKKIDDWMMEVSAEKGKSFGEVLLKCFCGFFGKKKRIIHCLTIILFLLIFLGFCSTCNLSVMFKLHQFFFSKAFL